MARVKELEIRLAQARDGAEIVRARLELEPRKRRHYSPRQRFLILRFMKTYVPSLKGTARRFLVSAQTVARWMKEASRHPERDTAGSLIEPVPPTRRLKARGIRQRFGAIGRTGSIAIVERFWRTLKDTLSVRSVRPMTKVDLERRLKAVVSRHSLTEGQQREA